MWDNTKNAHVYVNVIQFYYFRYFHCKSYQSKIKAETTVNIFWENGMKFAEFVWKIAEFNDAMSVNFSNKKKVHSRVRIFWARTWTHLTQKIKWNFFAKYRTTNGYARRCCINNILTNRDRSHCKLISSTHQFEKSMFFSQRTRFLLLFNKCLVSNAYRERQQIAFFIKVISLLAFTY